jgi:DNA-binding transcriptional regulator PaaX
LERATLHPHPHLDVAIGNFVRLLGTMGRSETEIRTTIAVLKREAGLDPA